MSALPFEIIEMIIGTLAQDDPCLSSTKACSLVCHDFLYICRKHIFGAIVLTDFNDRLNYEPWKTKTTTLMLQRLLDTKPELADHIRVLSYNIIPDDLEDVSLKHTFTKITRLKSLSVVSPYDTPNLLWNNNPLRPALLHLLHLPTLIHLKLLSINNFIITDLAPCINLRHLEFKRLTVMDPEANNSLPPNRPEKSIRLRQVSAGVFSAAATMKMYKLQCTDQTPFLDFSSLTDLSVDIAEHDDAEVFCGLLSRCDQISTLRIQDWRATNFTRIGLSKLLHPSMRTLKHLLIDTTIDERMENTSALSSLSCELEAMTTNNIIETITIGVDIESDINRKPGDQWDHLEEVLLIRSGWPKLQQVSFTITIWSYGYDEFRRISKKLPQTPFPKLSSSKTLFFEFAVVRGKYN